MRSLRIILLFGFLYLTFFSYLPVLAKTPPPYLSHQNLTKEIKSIASKNSKLARWESIGKTVQGRDIWSLVLTNFAKGIPAEKSAVCIVANVSGNYLSGSYLALETARYLLQQYEKTDTITNLLDHRVFYFIPCVNADAAEKYFQSPVFESARNFTPTDEDFDALIDEDGPEDLNGDGFISLMRIPDSKGEWLVDSSDVRLLRKANPNLGELGKFRLVTEGIDNDSDELINEDPLGGVNLNRNFPHLYPHYESGAGSFMLSEPESRAIISFFEAHRNISFTIIYDEQDNLLVPPKIQSKKNGKTKFPDKISEEDEFIYQRASSLYREITGLKIKPELKEENGSLAQWLYFQYGIPVFCARTWWPPETNEKADSTHAKTENNKKITKKIPRSKNAKSNDLSWLNWIDAFSIKNGFINWTLFQHPQLGNVEIGGFRPFIKTTPPEEQLIAAASRYIQFTLGLSALLPEISLAKVEIEKKDKSVFLLKVEVKKIGFLPVSTAFAHQKNLVKSTLARLKLNGATLLTGAVNVDLPHLAVHGQTEEIEWLIFTPKPTTIQLEILTEKAGKIKREITLQ